MIAGGLAGNFHPMKTATATVDQLVSRFAADLKELIKEEMRGEILGFLSGAPPVGGRFIGPGGPYGAAKKPSKVASPGVKRSAEDISKTAAKVLTYVRSHPDSRSEEIATAIGLSTSELVLPIKRLVTEKKLRAAGVARGTRYKSLD